MAVPTYSKAIQWAEKKLEQQSLDSSSAEYMLLERLNWHKTDLIMAGRETMPDSVWQQFNQDVQQLLTGKPAQYLLGYAWFDGLHLHVNEATLIPRFETEELVDWVANAVGQAQQDVRILDLGTGSGAIALALKHRLPEADLTATDISTDALQVAQDNAESLNSAIQFYQGDLFAAIPSNQPKFDFLVSNPPYISMEEITAMDQTVRQYEPKMALFADENGLSFYRKIMSQAPTHLKAHGQLFFEFGYQQATAIEQLCQQLLPQAKLEIHHDLAGWPRMARIQL